MEKWIANRVTGWCIRNNSVTGIQETAIRYGIELYLDTALKIILILCIGAVCGRFAETVIAIGCFCALRGEAGGIHMHSSLGCFLSMCTVALVSVAGSELLPGLPTGFAVLLFLIVGILLYLYAPYTTGNNPITDRVLIRRKKYRAVLIVAALTVISALLPGGRMRALLLIPVVIETITIIPLWRGREERNG